MLISAVLVISGMNFRFKHSGLSPNHGARNVKRKVKDLRPANACINAKNHKGTLEQYC